MNDPFHLERFSDAQEPVIEQVLSELRAGRKQTHWMWFVFPQFKGLGHSPTAQKYAISSVEEAKAYLTHPGLGPRLRECTQLVNNIKGRAADEIFGYPDDLKFRSSMTLFERVASDNAIFRDALNKYFAGQPDTRTLELLVKP